jgi:hypothetical protein
MCSELRSERNNRYFSDLFMIEVVSSRIPFFYLLVFKLYMLLQVLNEDAYKFSEGNIFVDYEHK